MSPRTAHRLVILDRQLLSSFFLVLAARPSSREWSCRRDIHHDL